MAGFETSEREINGRAYEIRALPARIGRKALVRLTRRLAPVIGEALEGAGGDVDALEKNIDLGGALSRFAQELTEEEFEHFCELFSAYTTVEHPAGSGKMIELKPAVFDEVFAARYADMVGWLRACLEVNFGGFFGEGGLLSATRQTPGK